VALLLWALGSSAALAQPTAQATLQAQGKVAEADARATALAKVPGGSISNSELEKEHGKLVWSHRFRFPRCRPLGLRNGDICHLQRDLQPHNGSPVLRSVRTPGCELHSSVRNRITCSRRPRPTHGGTLEVTLRTRWCIAQIVGSVFNSAQLASTYV